MTVHATSGQGMDAAAAVTWLEREPLCNIVLLKHLQAYAAAAIVTWIDGPRGTGVAVTLPAAMIPYDRAAYPTAETVVLVARSSPDVIPELIDTVPARGTVIFKLPDDGDARALAGNWDLHRQTSFISFSAPASIIATAGVFTGTTATDAMYALFALQDYGRTWLDPLLAADRAFTCGLDIGGDTAAVCLAYQNYGHIWEIGGVVTAAHHRGRGYGTRVVGAALSELARRDLVPRYQVREDNVASIRLARAAGLAPFLRLTHYLARR